MRTHKIPWAKPNFGTAEKRLLLKAFESGWVSGGRQLSKFQRDFTKKLGAKHGIAVSNGTSAIYLALLSLSIGKGDEVIVPGYCFAACANMVIACGARPVYADIDSNSWCIDPVSAQKAVSRKTKALIAVHNYGNVCDMDRLSAICKKNKITLIEDAAEAVFSKYRSNYAGTIGDIGCFSFHAAKTIAAGEGGFVLARNGRTLKRMQQIRDHGMSSVKKYWHNLIGFNFRFNNLQAAIASAQLMRAKEIISRRKKITELYTRYLKNDTGICLQTIDQVASPVMWTFAIGLDGDIYKKSRDAIIDRLLSFGIETRPGFYAFSDMPIYDAPILETSKSVSRSIVCLPMFHELKESQISYICDKLKSIKKK